MFMKKILVVCSNGLGSSLMLKSNIQKVLGEKGIQAKVDHCDLGSARAAASDVDLVVTSAMLAQELEDLQTPVVTILNFISVQEIEEKVVGQL
ncbi:PTS sugar transporter subunit IIB [Klebsiella pneumoniae]|nr:PTS sugar transporter subunit IIB [Klebsiella pneumoniae]